VCVALAKLGFQLSEVDDFFEREAREVLRPEEVYFPLTGKILIGDGLESVALVASDVSHERESRKLLTDAEHSIPPPEWLLMASTLRIGCPTCQSGLGNCRQGFHSNTAKFRRIVPRTLGEERTITAHKKLPYEYYQW